MAVQSTSVRDAEGRFRYGVRVVQDLTERKQAEERQRLLIDELNHRVKNTLASVQSLFWLTARGGPSLQEFRSSFEGRLIALSQAHDQLTLRHCVESAALKDIISVGTGPHFNDGHGQIMLHGRSVTLRPRAALSLAMAFHELTHRCRSKYGALWGELRQGRPRLERGSGRAARPGLAAHEWRETGGPEVSEPSRRGFGSTFIERSVAAELEAPPSSISTRMACSAG